MKFVEARLHYILQAKEERVNIQHRLLERFAGSSLISLTFNIPGATKLSAESLTIFDMAEESIVKYCNPRYTQVQIGVAGIEAFYVCQKEAKSLKELTCKIEMEHPLGRFMDIDVIDATKEIISRGAVGHAKRKCYLCDNEAFMCARTQAHSIEALLEHIAFKVKEHAFFPYLMRLAFVAMRKEVELTPKPGLVDSANNGAHQDMTIETFYKSIDAIAPFVKQYAQGASTIHYQEPHVIFKTLRQIGLTCEAAMFRATKGVNTHKGMIFSLAVLSGALGLMKTGHKPFTCKELSETVKALCVQLVANDLMLKKPDTAGARFFYETNSLGIRGEAQNGFPTLFEISLPLYRSYKKSHGEEIALKMTLLQLMAILDDSTLWSRGGMEGLRYVKEKSSNLLLHVKAHPEDLEHSLHELDEDLISKNLSPGGSADMLALTWFVDACVEI